MKFMKSILMAAAFGLSAAGAHAATLDDVKAKGFIQCGVSQGLIGFSNADSNNVWTGLDVDYCRAVAAAVFGDASKVKYTPLSAKERFTALQSGAIDILSRNSTWTMSRDTTLGLSFVGVTYYDGQGFMVPAKLEAKSAKDLNGASVCTQTGTTTELNLSDYFKANKMEYKIVAFEKNEEVLKAYQDGRCDVFTTDQSGLYAEALKFPNPADHVVLPEIISKEPLGPVVRQGDPQWFNIAKWTYYALLNAEELGVNSKNVDEMKSSENPEIQRLLSVKVKSPDGTEADNDFGKGIGLGPDWAYNIVKLVGNYDEVFHRNLDALKIAKGKNALWKDGGLQYAPPVR